LIEFSFHEPPDGLTESIRLILDHAYIPVIAHPERYRYYHEQFHMYESFKTMGCLLQMNLNALAGYYGGEEKTIAIKLLQHGLIDYAGTDMHHIRHLESLKSLQQESHLMKILQDYPFQNMYI
jgi:protein-tyrosine phosphatase